MYFQKDYVLRMIEMMGELMQRIGTMLKEADARKELDEISGRACGMPMSVLRTAEPDTLEELLAEPQRFLAAELLLINVEVDRRAKLDEELLPLQIQALSLLCTMREPDYMLPACDKASAIMDETLDQLPLELLLRVAALQEKGGRYAAAEDALFAALCVSPDCLSQAESFYDRLDALDDKALLVGGLSRDEISEGRAALNGRLNG